MSRLVLVLVVLAIVRNVKVKLDAKLNRPLHDDQELLNH